MKYAVGRITTHILKSSNFVNLYLKNMNKTCTSGLTSEGRGFMLNSNKTNYSGHLCKDNDDDDDESHLLPCGCMRMRQCGLPPIVTSVTRGNILHIKFGWGVAVGDLILWVVWSGWCCLMVSHMF